MRLRAWRCPPCRRAPQAGCGSRLRSAGAGDCRTPRHKTHNTASAAEVVVAYSWHPWAGHLVHVHEAIEREAGAWARCSLVGADVARLREIPTWMHDASVCRSMWRAPAPVAALSALVSLRALLSEAMENAAAALPGAAIASAPPHRGGRHAPPPSPGPDTGASTRTLLGASGPAQPGEPGPPVRDARAARAARLVGDRGDRRRPRPLRRRRRGARRLRAHGGRSLPRQGGGRRRARGLALRPQQPRLAAARRDVPRGRHLADRSGDG